nr:hypothetical protein [Gammaproteobacteria bacterium]
MTDNNHDKKSLVQNVRAALYVGAVAVTASSTVLPHSAEGSAPEDEFTTVAPDTVSVYEMPEHLLSQDELLSTNQFLLAQAGEALECSRDTCGGGSGGGGDPYEPIYIPPELAEQLAEDCFVATAVTGSRNSSIVKDLSDFRDNVLFEHKAGRIFIYWYYRNGPAIANWIRDRRLFGKVAEVSLRAIAKVVPVNR